MSVIRVALVGLGATGQAIGSSMSRRMDCRIVGAADPRPELIGTDVGHVLGVGPLGVAVVGDTADLPDADVAIVATTSHVAQVADIAVPLLERSVNVVSICEELAYPWYSHPDVAARLDFAAKSNNVSVLGTGANPGMIMDTLPLLLSSLTQNVNSVVIRRQTDMSRYSAILSKFGLGLTPEEFAAATADGAVIGHVGFEQAIAALAGGLGWQLDKIIVDPVRPAFVTDSRRVGTHLALEPGTIAAVRHAARGMRGGRHMIDLEIVFGFFEDRDEIRPGDSCRIEGDEQTVEINAATGFESFLSTIAVAANAATAVVDARPGLLSMADLPVVAIASKGGRRRESTAR
ncbi:hypothetical protein M2272_005220 [Mycobacterium frederiksbergense]|uniref:Dihydrodipicolinate reductase n=1 Tax=Mycolicibacterium frederiksbergense TaxID=117567 RepID=A0ABT6L6I6_9MYCO|nr:dihydrodipicolinate reductase [Mycolicibacterium frederiksbergense]MDH6198561.1 hypothetical protein [Mycolicibacterium frederiksbergense]